MATHLGELGAEGGILRPVDLTVQRDGGTWDLTGYTDPEWRVWDADRTEIPVTGTVTVVTAATGVVRYAPADADPIHLAAGLYRARIWVTPSGGGDPEPSGLFTFRIGAGPDEEA